MITQPALNAIYAKHYKILHIHTYIYTFSHGLSLITKHYPFCFLSSADSSRRAGTDWPWPLATGQARHHPGRAASATEDAI